MARLYGSKSQKLDSIRSQSEKENPYIKCSFKMEYPPITEDLYTRMKQDRNLGPNNCSQNPTAKGKLRFQCHFEDRKKRAELRRKKIIQKLKKNYAIDVDGLNEDVTRELIMKAEMMEKEKHQREKRNVERMVTMITRLLEEQKYKNRGNKIYPPPWRKPLRNIPGSKSVGGTPEQEAESIEDVGDRKEEGEWVTEHSTHVLQESSELKIPEKKKSAEEEEIEGLPRCVEPKKSQKLPKIESSGKLVRKSKASCAPVEKCLESTPRRVVFNDYEKDKVYLQDLKITNIGMETVHCRYLGIIVQTKGENRFPIGVAVRDSVKLRPGLCCSTKIRLCSQEDTKELRCSVVYETRRQRNPLQHSWFFVPVVCVPVRAIVRVIPLKITFPSLTWCEATGPEGAKILHKILKIENSGGKACTCRISKASHKDENSEEEEGELDEQEGESRADSIKIRSYKSEQDYFQYSSFRCSEEFDGEGSLMPCGVAAETAKLLVDELFENIFEIFRFSIKHCIDVPPFSTAQIEVKFIPQYKGFHHEMYLIQFEDSENCKEQTIQLVGDIKQIPLRVEPEVIDLNICIANSGVYAGTFKIFNESKGPFSVILKVPSSLKKHAHVYPRATTILPLNYSDFSVRIYPRVTLAMDAPRHYKENSQILEFPIFIHPANVGACKRDCLKIYIFALITDYCLELAPSSINFGTVTTLETVRTELELTNHSLTMQEYGFLNLPKGVRVEPNMGFGKILPKESITLYLLYSPEEDLIECEDTREGYEFQIAVTSIAKYGGFREKLEPDDEPAKSIDFIWGEDYVYDYSTLNLRTHSSSQTPYIQPEDLEDFDACEEESSIEGEELQSKICEQETKIREFLRLDGRKISEYSYFKRMIYQADGLQQSKDGGGEKLPEYSSVYGESEEFKYSKGMCSLKSNLNVVTCRAFIVKPRCRLSETVIQLPAASCSSFCLYRFRLSCIKEAGDINCCCGFRKVSKCGGKQKPQSSFEFQYFYPPIKLEPESGVIKPGDTLPITIIHRPEFPAEQLQHESRLNKVQKIMEAKPENEKQPTSKAKQTKGLQITPKSKMTESSGKNTVEDVINVASFELENSDLFAGEKSLAKLISPFYTKTKLQCIVKTTSCDDRSEKTEIHEMVLICPAIKPNFIYLGNSQEINFNKVFVGTRSKTILEFQNISLKRTTPSATLLNPVGSFLCPAGVRKVEVDPEHIWRQPLVYAPLVERGIEKQFFEIFCGSTNIFLTVSGEGVQPEFGITPNFACCKMEGKSESPGELKFDIENRSPIELKLNLKTVFVKEGPDLEIPREVDVKVEEERKVKKEKEVQQDENKDKKKSKNSGKENFQFWNEVPEVISSGVENFTEISEEEVKVFILSGVNNDNEIVIPPSGKQPIKIQFKPPADKNDKSYAIKYVFMLERVSPLKEILVIGKIFRGK